MHILNNHYRARKVFSKQNQNLECLWRVRPVTRFCPIKEKTLIFRQVKMSPNEKKRPFSSFKIRMIRLVKPFYLMLSRCLKNSAWGPIVTNLKKLKFKRISIKMNQFRLNYLTSKLLTFKKYLPNNKALISWRIQSKQNPLSQSV